MHSLVVGGTGMLREATVYLADRSVSVSLIARRAEAFRPNIHPLPLDYRDSPALAEALRAAIARHGPIELALCWIHSTAPGALAVVAEELALPGRPFRLFHVRGSAAANPNRQALPGLSPTPPLCSYRQVVLGWIREHGHSRWLTNTEISRGAIEAIERDAPYSVIGVVTPWNERPA